MNSAHRADERDATMGRMPQWGAVFALTLCFATLIATDLYMSEGRVGQAISVSGIFAVLTSLVIASATRGIDRRIVLLSLFVSLPSMPSERNHGGGSVFRILRRRHVLLRAELDRERALLQQPEQKSWILAVGVVCQPPVFWLSGMR